MGKKADAKLKAKSSHLQVRANKSSKGGAGHLLLSLVFVVGACLVYFRMTSSSASGSIDPNILTFPLPPDTRPAGCHEQMVDPVGRSFQDLKVSIIIPYKNERWEHIQASIQSILFYTPLELVSEILFVSDGNPPNAVFGDGIRATSPLCRVLELPEVGLISAKMRGVEATQNESTVIAFLEPHIRVNREWLQPLLARVRQYPKVLAMPVIDYIPQDNFNQYFASDPGVWRFEWNLNLIFTNPGGKAAWTKTPVTSPATSGGIFAIRKDWWNTLELYDEGMIGWGGDHIEATMKVWRCGGHIEMVPCARIGHLFRSPDHRPYDVDVERVVKNYARIASVWLDAYVEQFYRVKGEARSMTLGDLSDAHALRSKLQCHDMKWYLEHVDAEMNWEKDHICIPGCKVPNVCCENPAHPGRSTIDRIIPKHLYKPPILPSKSATTNEL